MNVTTAESLDALSAAVDLDLHSYRPDHVAQRVVRALEVEQAGDVAELAEVLGESRSARARFRRAIAVPVSGIFRDGSQFDLLEERLLPLLAAGGRRITVWSAGCADGTELYSVAVLLERLGALERSLLLGSDLLAENLAAARRGVYGDVEIPEAIRVRARWERRDLLRDGAAPGSWRLILCRNLAIYLAPEAKRALHESLSGALARDGILLLGRSEWLTEAKALGLERIAPHAYRRSP